MPKQKSRWLLCRSLLALLLLLAAACGEDDDSAPVTGVAVPFQPASSGITAFGDIPWPSDLYRDQEGNVVEVPGLSRVASMPASIVRGLADLDGFGRASGATFFVDVDLDSDSLPRTWEAATRRDVSVFFVDVDESSPKLGTRYPAYAKYLPSLHCLSVIPVPGIVLPPGVRHAAVVTSRVRTSAGERLVSAEELDRILQLPAQGRTTAAEQLYGDAYDQLLAHRQVARSSDVASLAVFTTSQRAFELPELRARLYDEPDPTLILDPTKAGPYTVAIFGTAGHPSLDEWFGIPEKDETGREWPGFDNPGGIAHDKIGVIASGAFVAPSFSNGATHHFERDPQTGAVVLALPDTKIPVTIVIPRQPPPTGGYPVVIHGHGLSNHRGSMLGIANELARAGFVMIGIDDVLHGARQGIRDEHSNFFGTYQGPDGIPDGVGFPIAFFAGFADFIAMRDNFRQTVLDETSLVRLIQSTQLDLSPLATAGGITPTLDPSRIYWNGGSLGGIIGSMTLGVEPEIRAAALQVPGTGFVQLISTNSAELAPLVGSLARSILGVRGDEDVDEFHPVGNLLAAVTEAGDPMAYAPHVLQNPLLPERTPPDIMITYAVDDEVLPNVATIALIRALGVELATPRLREIPGVPTAKAPVQGNLKDGTTAAAVQYYPANHGLGYSRYDTRKFLPGFPLEGADRFPHLPKDVRFEQPIREEVAQLVEFLSTVANGDHGRIEVTVPAREDFDADGVLDADERTHGTDPLDPASL